MDSDNPNTEGNMNDDGLPERLEITGDDDIVIEGNNSLDETTEENVGTKETDELPVAGESNNRNTKTENNSDIFETVFGDEENKEEENPFELETSSDTENKERGLDDDMFDLETSSNKEFNKVSEDSSESLPIISKIRLYTSKAFRIVGKISYYLALFTLLIGFLYTVVSYIDGVSIISFSHLSFMFELVMSAILYMAVYYLFNYVSDIVKPYNPCENY